MLSLVIDSITFGRQQSHAASLQVATTPLYVCLGTRSSSPQFDAWLDCRVFGTASYYVQKLFSEFQGVRYIDTTVSTPEHDPRDHGIAASATCQDEDCTQLAFKASLHMLAQSLTLLNFHVANYQCQPILLPRATV